MNVTRKISLKCLDVALITAFLVLAVANLLSLSGCVTIVCNSTDYKEQSEVFTDEATKNQAEKINNDGGLL